MTTRCWARKSSTSSSVILIWSRRLTASLRAGARGVLIEQPAGDLVDRLARVLGGEPGAAAPLLEPLAHEPVHAGEAELDDDGAVGQLGHDVALLRGPA